MTKVEKIKATLQAMANGVDEYTPGCGLYRFLVIRSILKAKGIKAAIADPKLIYSYIQQYDEKAAEREDERISEKPGIETFTLDQLLTEIKKRGVIVKGSLHLMKEIKF